MFGSDTRRSLVTSKTNMNDNTHKGKEVTLIFIVRVKNRR